MVSLIAIVLMLIIPNKADKLLFIIFLALTLKAFLEHLL